MICKKCGFKCYESELICPICETVLVDFDPNNKKIQLLPNEKIKTNKFVMISLSLLLWIGCELIILFDALEYRYVGSGRFDISNRQFIITIIVWIHMLIIFKRPLLNSNLIYKRKNKFINKEIKKNTEIIYYLTFLGIFILFWHIFYRGFIQNDMLNYFSISSERPNLENRLRFYAYSYQLGVLFCYLPYLIYHYFDLKFEYSDIKGYYNFFGFVIMGINILVYVLYVIGVINIKI